MKILALALCVSLAAPAPAPPPPQASTAPAQGAELSPIVVTASRLSPEEERALKQTRAVGGTAAASGLGLLLYAAVAGGPVGWAAALIFVGGMSAYLSHRRLAGEDDFHDKQEPPPRDGGSPP